MSRTRATPASRRLAPHAQAILVGIARSLEAVEERLTALAPHTRLAEPHVRELREIRALVMALTDSRAQEGEGGIIEGWDVSLNEPHPGG